jgi:hypothetical protein
MSERRAALRLSKSGSIRPIQVGSSFQDDSWVGLLEQRRKPFCVPLARCAALTPLLETIMGELAQRLQQVIPSRTLRRTIDQNEGLIDHSEYAAVEARNLAPPPGDVDFTVGASLPTSGLTAWQGLLEHGRLQATMVTQLAREFGAYVIGTGRAADRQKALEFGAQEFVDLDNDALEDVGGVDLVFDVIGGDI